MKFSFFRPTTLWVAASALVWSLPAVAAQATASDVAEPARVIVKFKANAATLRRHALSMKQMGQALASSEVLQKRALALGARQGRKLTAGRGLSERMQVITASGIDSAALARVLARDSEVEYAEVDQRRQRLAVPNDPLYEPVAGLSPASGQWYLKPPTASSARNAADLVSSIDAPAAWDLTTGSANIVVAVLDSGVRADHVDLAEKMLPGYDMVTSTVTSNDGNARDSDASDPGDFVTSADLRSAPFYGNCNAESSSWHGTMVSGLVGASANNGIGMAGITWNSKILPVRVLGKCFGYDSDIIAGMRWAAGLSVAGVPASPTPARVLNLSLGGSGECTASYADAMSDITAAGVVVVVAAGNGSGLAVSVPANCPGVIGVTGLRHAGTKVGFANVGSSLSIAAPGGNCLNDSGGCMYPILSTTNSGDTTPVAGQAGSAYTDSSNYAVGTSFSAPMVSGTVALMLAVNPALTPSQVTQLVKSTARAFPASGGSTGTATCHAPNGASQYECYCTTSTCGAGMLDAGAAVRAAASLGAGTSGPLQARVSVSPAVPDPGNTVTLSAAATQLDTGRRIASTAWSLVDGGGIVTGFGGATHLAAATVTPSAIGSFTVRLTVVDDLGNSSTRDATISVATLSAQAIASVDAATVGQTVTFSASNLQLSAGRTLASQGWLLLDGGGVVASLGGSSSGASVTAVPTAAGTFAVRLTVTDDLGKQATSDVRVSVTATAGASANVLNANAQASGSSGGDGGGGGAVPAGWSLGLALGTAALLATRRRAKAGHQTVTRRRAAPR